MRLGLQAALRPGSRIGTAAAIALFAACAYAYLEWAGSVDVSASSHDLAVACAALAMAVWAGLAVCLAIASLDDREVVWPDPAEDGRAAADRPEGLPDGRKPSAGGSSTG
jgi:hypothetical protein